MSISFRCIEGPLAGELIGLDRKLEFGRELRGPGSLGGDSRLSRRHALVSLDGDGHPVVEDLGSTNGTWVNGERISARRTLRHGDELRLGRSALEVQVVPDTPATQPAPDATELTSAPHLAPPPAVAAPHLRVLDGPLKGRDIPVGDELLLGRSYGDPGSLGGDKLLSRRHARIARGASGVFFIEDTGSTNGTKLNHVAVRGAHPVADGNELELGSSRLLAERFPSPIKEPPPREPEPIEEPSPRIEEPPPRIEEPPPRIEEPPPREPEPIEEPPPEEPVPSARPSAVSFVPQGAADTRLSSRRTVWAFAVVFALAAAVAVAVIAVVRPLGSRSCPKGFVCQPPPRTPPLQSLARFTGSLGWHVEYDSKAATPLSQSVSGNRIALTETGTTDSNLGMAPGSQNIGVVVQGFNAAQTAPTAAVQNLAGTLTANLVGATQAPSSDQMFSKPVLGFQPAVGEVKEGYLRTPQGPGPLLKVAVMAGSSGGVTVAAGLLYPVQKGQTQQSNPDQPFDNFGDAIFETVRFPDDGSS